jgi:lysozyme family protein
MAMANFAACLAFTLNEEGGLTDNPNDPGGLTNKGITLATFQRYYPELGPDDLRVINDIQVAAIYRQGYWDLAQCDLLPAGIDLEVFDFGVNAGPGRSIGYLQVVVGVKEDFADGPITEAAALKMDATTVITKLSGLQRAHYIADPGYPIFGDGWIARLERRVIASLKMLPARGATPNA